MPPVPRITPQSEFLLHEFSLTPTLYLERFNTISRQNDETSVLYCFRLKGLINYYCKSRAVTYFNSLISLLVSDRIKTTLSDDCLKYILRIEAATENGWLPHNQLSEKIDVYHANHWNDKTRTGAIGKTIEFSSNYSLKATRGQDKSQAPSFSHKTDYVKKEKTCFRSKSTSHLIANCPVKSPGDNNCQSYTNKSAKVNRCAVTDYCENDTSAPSGDANNHVSATPNVECAGLEIARECLSAVYNTANNVDISHVLQATVSSDSKCEKYVNYSDFASLKYTDIVIPEVICDIISSLSDSGAEVCFIKSSILEGSNVLPIGKVRLRGLVGQRVEAELINLTVRLADDEDCWTTVLFAKCSAVNEDCILTAEVVNKLTDLYNRKVILIEANNVTDSMDSVNEETSDDDESNDGYIDVDCVANNSQTINSKASADLVQQEQQLDDTIAGGWALAKRNKGGYFVKGGLIYRLENVTGYKTESLLIPSGRRTHVLTLAHELFGGHLTVAKTRDRIRMSGMTWPTLMSDCKTFTRSCIKHVNYGHA